MSNWTVRRITAEHTTAEAIEIMKDDEAQSVVVVDRETLQVLGSLSRATLIEGCVRGWHEPERCRVLNHLDLS